MSLVVDCSVLVHGSGEGDIAEYREPSYEFLKRFREDRRLFLAVDARGHIEREYGNRVRAPMFAHQWLAELQRDERIEVIASKGLPQNPHVRLREAHLHKKDFPLVQAAYHSGRVIITTDRNSFQPKIVTILRRYLDLRVYFPDQAAWLFMNERDF